MFPNTGPKWWCCWIVNGGWKGWLIVLFHPLASLGDGFLDSASEPWRHLPGLCTKVNRQFSVVSPSLIRQSLEHTRVQWFHEQYLCPGRIWYNFSSDVDTGVWLAYGIALGFRWMWAGIVEIRGDGADLLIFYVLCQVWYILRLDGFKWFCHRVGKGRWNDWCIQASFLHKVYPVNVIAYVE